MRAIKVDKNHILIPSRAESKGVIGDGYLLIDKQHPDWEVWQPFVD